MYVCLNLTVRSMKCAHCTRNEDDMVCTKIFCPWDHIKMYNLYKNVHTVPIRDGVSFPDVKQHQLKHSNARKVVTVYVLERTRYAHGLNCLNWAQERIMYLLGVFDRDSGRTTRQCRLMEALTKMFLATICLQHFLLYIKKGVVLCVIIHQFPIKSRGEESSSCSAATYKTQKNSQPNMRNTMATVYWSTSTSTAHNSL